MCARDRDDELEDEFEAGVQRQRELIERGRREHGQSFWRYVGLIGVVGWSVVVPMAIGVLLGLWIDRKYHTGSRWTLILLLFGLCIGCVNAWRMITKED
jgi:ATP synthase protein I